MTNKESLTINTLYSTITKIHDLEKFSLEDISNFSEYEVTSKTAKKYLTVLKEMYSQVDKFKDSEKFRALITVIVSKFCESECKGEIIKHMSKKDLKKLEVIKQLQIDYQKERDECNKLREQLNLAQKEKIIDLPCLKISIIEEKNSLLSTLDCIKLAKQVDEEYAFDNNNMVRVKVPEEFENSVGRVYVAKSDAPNYKTKVTSAIKNVSAKK